MVKQLSDIRSLSANFEQTTKAASGAKSATEKGLTGQHMNQTFTGVMKVARPGNSFGKPAVHRNRPLLLRAKPSGFMIQIYNKPFVKV